MLNSIAPLIGLVVPALAGCGALLVADDVGDVVRRISARR
jgi:hypothetical protein